MAAVVGFVITSLLALKAQGVDLPSLSETTDETCTIIHLDPYELDAYVRKHKLVFVNFCRQQDSCESYARSVSKLSFTLLSRVKFASINADEHPAVPVIYGVDKFPEIKVFVDGKMKDELVRSFSDDEIKNIAKKFAMDLERLQPDEKQETWKALELDPESLRNITWNSSLNSFIMFYTTSCKRIDHFINELEIVAEAFSEHSNVKIARMDADIYPEATHRYTTHGLPSFVFFGEADPFFGFKPKELLYADMRVASAMAHFLNRKCRLQVKLPAKVKTDHSEGQATEPLPTDHDAPAWIFEPAA